MRTSCGESDVIRTFWHGSDLGIYEELALASFVRLGHTVELFSYHPLRTIPGVQHVDATAILPESEVFSYQTGPGKGSFAAFSNLFRYKLLYERGGTWVDLDVLCLKHVSNWPSPCAGWEDETLVNSAILRFPPKHSMTEELYHRARQLGRNISWGEAGPRLMTEIALRSREEIALVPREIFFPIHWTDAWKLVSAKELPQCLAATTQSFCVHWWHEMLRHRDIRENILPPRGSYLEQRAREILGEEYLKQWPTEMWKSRLRRHVSPRGAARRLLRTARHGIRRLRSREVAPQRASGVEVERCHKNPPSHVGWDSR